MLALVIILYCTSKLVTATEQCDTYQFSHPFYPGESCEEIYDWNPQTHNWSGYYWLINPLRRVYCDMEHGIQAYNSCKEIYDLNPQTHNRSGYYWLINPLRRVYCDMEHGIQAYNSCKEIYDLNPQTHNRSGYYWLINPLRRVYCDMEHGVQAYNSCKEIYDLNPQTHNRSGYYWLINPLRRVYCDMEQRVVCGNIGGWTRIASVNITRGDECPTGWTKSSRDGISFCRSPSDNAGCYPILFSSKGISYQKVCGMARGYQKGSLDGYSNNDALSITHGSPRQHIWTYEVRTIDTYCNCDSAADEFTGSNFYCESGVNSGGHPNHATHYLSDPLWDGLDCPTGNTCCDNPNLPWFYRELDLATMDDVEVRICTNENFGNEAILVDQLVLYIQ